MKNIKQQLAQRVDNVCEHPSFNKDITEEGSYENSTELNQPGQIQALPVVPEFAITIMDAKSRIDMLQSFVKEMMVPDVDYGLIPNCAKPTLFKSGAEKLCDIFGFSKKAEVTNRIEDWDKGLFHYEVKVSLINKRNGLIEAEGIGCCNNQEKKYKNQDPFSIVNTILKMAKKRSLVDAVLSATRSSGMFTQDIEDDEFQHSQDKQFRARPQQNSVKSFQASESQLKLIYQLVSINRIPTNTIKGIILERYGVTESRMLNSKQASDLITFLKDYGADKFYKRA